MPSDYTKALAEGKRIGASRADGDAGIALTVAMLGVIHGLGIKARRNLFAATIRRKMSDLELFRISEKDPLLFAELITERDIDRATKNQNKA